MSTTIITDKGIAFTSNIIAEITRSLEIKLKCATTKHPQTIGTQTRADTRLIDNKFENDLRGKPWPMAQLFASSCAQL